MGFFAAWGVVGAVILIAGYKDATDLVFIVPLVAFTAALLYGAIAGKFPDIPNQGRQW